MRRVGPDQIENARRRAPIVEEVAVGQQSAALTGDNQVGLLHNQRILSQSRS